ncbi:MAG TPA: hypothetical protein PLT06_11495 [Syntrophorhabdaceae bacterium]|jgi:hypothetical protein|nr:hypothetical protein [Syntrophorhabdaceae bacterium]
MLTVVTAVFDTGNEKQTLKEEVITTKNGKPVLLMRFVSNRVFKLKKRNKKKEVKIYGKKNEGTV